MKLPNLFASNVGHSSSDLYFQGPIITDLGGLPGSYNEMMSDEFERLLEKMGQLKIMTISPHAEASYDYRRIECLLKRCKYSSNYHGYQSIDDELAHFLEHPSQCRDTIIVKRYWTSLALMSLTFYIVRTPLLFAVSANFIGISLLIPYSCFQQDVIILCMIQNVIQREHYTYYNYV